MSNKVLAWIILASFLASSWSCVIYTWERTPVQSVKPEKREKAKISSVQTKAGEKIEFNKRPAARFQGDSVVGEKFFNKTAIEELKTEKPKYFLSGTPFLITTEDGTVYRVTSWADVKDTIILKAHVPLSVPLSDIDLVWVRKVNYALTYLLILLGPVALYCAGLGVVYGLGVHT